MLYELTITNVSFDDAGDYYCSAQNLVEVANTMPFDPWMSAWGVLAVRGGNYIIRTTRYNILNFFDSLRN